MADFWVQNMKVEGGNGISDVSLNSQERQKEKNTTNDDIGDNKPAVIIEISEKALEASKGILTIKMGEQPEQSKNNFKNPFMKLYSTVSKFLGDTQS
ncbi:MAG: hypothetical protein AAGB12_16930 [Pseudomonadota bacterium]